MASIVMFFVVTLVSLCIAAAMTHAEECSAGIIKRGDICCKPKICEINEDYRLCNNTHREDRCIPCPPNTTNQDIINTSRVYEQIPGICKEIECFCLPEARIKNLDECLMKTEKAICECNHDKGFCGEDPKTCEICDGNMTDPNYDSLAGKCKPGYFKDTKGNGPCSKHRNCSEGEIIIFNGNSTMDRQCGPSTETQTTTENPDKIIIGSVVGSIVLLAVIIPGVWMGRKKFGQLIQRMKNAVLNNGVNDQLNIPEEQNCNAEPSEDTSMV